ncbi:MAG: hypothetical protein ABI190_07070, partial [Casimicrobiaceae bacterium]
AKKRATIRRLVAEVDNYFDKAIDPISGEVFHPKAAGPDDARLAAGREATIAEYALFTRYMSGDFLAGPLSAADFALYPLVAFLSRCDVKLPGFNADAMLTPELRAWKARMEGLPYLDKTIPPHWKT